MRCTGANGGHTGTWIPLTDGRELAAKNGVLEKLNPIFDFVPGDRSPPPAPKHSTAASSRPRAPRAPAQPRRQPTQAYAQPDYDAMDMSMQDEATPDNVTTISESYEDDYMAQYTNSRKRRRVEDVMSQADTAHRMWAEDLLDYFMLQDSPLDSLPHAPQPPEGVDLNRPIDEKGHTALHWAAAMGDMEIVKDLIRRGVSIDVPSKNGETPLMRAVMFTNSSDRQNMDRLAGLLIKTVAATEWFGSTVFHHISNTTQRKSKYPCARYYMDTLLNKMSELYSPAQIEEIINMRDNNGDTAGTIAARFGARKCVRSLLGRNADMSIINNVGENAEQFIVQLNSRRQERAAAMRQLSSSPFQGDHATMGGAVQASASKGMSFDPNHSINGGSDVYRSEAAISITSQIMPVVVTKAKALASSLEEEMADRMAEVAEAERVLALRRAEADTVRRQQEDLLRQEQEQLSEALASDEQLAEELRQLETECRGLTGEEANFALRELIAAEQARNPTPNGTASVTSPMSETEETRQQLLLSRQLLALSQARRELIDEVVESIASASSADPRAMDHQEQYKRLITGALGVREEDVEGMLPEILAELEDGRGDGMVA